MIIISNFSIPEGLMCTVAGVIMKINQTSLESGTLYVAANSLSWQKDGRPDGISIPWENIGLHAISDIPTKCIYLMLDVELKWPGVYEGPESNGNDIDNDAEEDEGTVDDEQQEMTEIWLIPTDPNIVGDIFNHMKQCQILHPDPNDFSDGDEDIDDEYDEDVDNNMRDLNIDENDKRFEPAD